MQNDDKRRGNMENEREILIAELEKLAERLTYEQLRSVYIFTLQKTK
jgi:hypothetical protein